ncbi:MAG: hypothetical protein AUG51_23910 [Acidobacteria bacterium 13_1_20CM_3_53_8]|nr:MAG: hypothetical protein AUG51_23910 [Acidobacteria bacterium 13_1_20CM_3_53_8]
MHNCQETKERLPDLIFGEMDFREKERTLAELERCPSCDAEYRSLASTLFIYDRAARAAQPDESFWPAHHERLRASYGASPALAPHVAEIRAYAPLWKRILTASVRVPAPLAIASLSLLAVTTLLALRPPRTTVSTARPETRVETRTVEVPVPQDRVVIRTVYVDRSRREGRANARRDNGQNIVSNQTASARPNPAENQREVLQGFKPADTVNLHIIKGSFPR